MTDRPAPAPPSPSGNSPEASPKAQIIGFGPKRVTKRAVRVAARSISIFWVLTTWWLLLLALDTVGTVVGNGDDLLGSSLISAAVLIGTGMVLLFTHKALSIAFKTRCPHCNFRFLRNPALKKRFTYHPSCPGKLGFKPWTVQMCRFQVTGRIRCVNCGEEVFS